MFPGVPGVPGSSRWPRELTTSRVLSVTRSLFVVPDPDETDQHNERGETDESHLHDAFNSYSAFNRYSAFNPFTGTFEGETAPTPPTAARNAALFKPEHAAALAKYEVDPNQPIPVRKAPRRAASLVRIELRLGIAIVSCALAGIVLFKLTARNSIPSDLGLLLLVSAVLLIIALTRVLAGRRR